MNLMNVKLLELEEAGRFSVFLSRSRADVGRSEEEVYLCPGPRMVESSFSRTEMINKGIKGAASSCVVLLRRTELVYVKARKDV